MARISQGLLLFRRKPRGQRRVRENVIQQQQHGPAATAILRRERQATSTAMQIIETIDIQNNDIETSIAERNVFSTPDRADRLRHTARIYLFMAYLMTLTVARLYSVERQDD
jgi:hypothetical protein